MAWGKPTKSSKCHFTVFITIDGPTNSGRVENGAVVLVCVLTWSLLAKACTHRNLVGKGRRISMLCGLCSLTGPDPLSCITWLLTKALSVKC